MSNHKLFDHNKIRSHRDAGQGPEISINRAMQNYLNPGYSKERINQPSPNPLLKKAKTYYQRPTKERLSVHSLYTHCTPTVLN
jgi:hypothetical protein